jgi:hypothetical protein
VVSGDAIVVLSSEHDSLVRMAADGRRLGVLRVPHRGVRSRTTTYQRFAANGQLRDSVRLGDEARIFDARDDLLLVGTTDEDGVERVLLMRQKVRGR